MLSLRDLALHYNHLEEYVRIFQQNCDKRHSWGENLSGGVTVERTDPRGQAAWVRHFQIECFHRQW